MHRLLYLVLLAAWLGAAGCNVDPYCINCLEGDGGGGDGGDRDGAGDGGPGLDGPDGAGGDAGPCVATGSEICDGLDNDCNGAIDDGVLPQVGDACGSSVGVCRSQSRLRP